MSIPTTARTDPRRDTVARPVCIALGANLGDAEGTIRRAVEALRDGEALRNVRVSSLCRTSPVGPVAQPEFVNAALAGETSWEPEPLLAWLHTIEADLGRRREGAVRWGPRPIDLDLLLVGDLVRGTPSVTLPHPEMTRRRFVLEPLAEIAPEAVHPTSGLTVRQLLEALP